MTTAAPARRRLTIPAAAAEEIGRQYDQGMVVILSVNRDGAETTVTTWGRNRAERTVAAKLGAQITAFVGCDADVPTSDPAADFYRNEEPPATETKPKAERDAVGILRRLIEENAIASKHTQAVEEFLLHC